MDSPEFDLYRFHPEADEDQVYAFVVRKYTFESLTKGCKYLTYNTDHRMEETIWGYAVVEAIAVLSPYPASAKRPKLLEPGRLVFVKGQAKSKFSTIPMQCFLTNLLQQRCCNLEVHSEETKCNKQTHSFSVFNQENPHS